MSGRQPAESKAAKGSLKDGPRFESPLAYRWTRQLPFLSHISGSYHHATVTMVRFLFTRHWRTQAQGVSRAFNWAHAELTLRSPSQSLHVLLAPSHRRSGASLPSSPIESPRALRTLFDRGLGPAIRRRERTLPSGVEAARRKGGGRRGDAVRCRRIEYVLVGGPQRRDRPRMVIYYQRRLVYQAVCVFVYQRLMQAEASTAGKV